MADLTNPPMRCHTRLHRPKFYRYRVADPGLGFVWNRYPGAVIGAALRIGAHAYCVKWGRAV